jgi:hypothetical protein
MSAWAADEMDDEANITWQTPPFRRMQIIKLISLAPKVVKDLVRKLRQHAKRLTSHEREGRQVTVKIVAMKGRDSTSDRIQVRKHVMPNCSLYVLVQS